MKIKFTKAGKAKVLRRKVDTYGHPVKTYRRHKDCKCKIPCQARFMCTSTMHEGRRGTPWCFGAADDLPDFCDRCWCKAHKKDKAA